MTTADVPAQITGPGHLVIDAHRFTWCSATSQSVQDISLHQALELLDRPLVEPIGTPREARIGPRLDPGTLVVAQLPVAAIVGDGAAHCYVQAEGRWARLGPAHLQVLAAIDEETPVEHVRSIVGGGGPQSDEHVSTIIEVLVAVGSVTLRTGPVAGASMDPSDEPTSAHVQVPTTMGRLVRRVLGMGRSAEPTAAAAGVVGVDGAGTSSSGNHADPGRSTRPGTVPVYSFWATEEGPPMGVASVVAYARVHDDGRLNETYDLRRMTTPELVLDDLRNHSGPAVLLCGNYDWSLDANLAVVAQAQAVCPDIVVIHGGPSTPSRQEDCKPFLAALSGSHVAVAGEGEITFAEVLERLQGTNDLRLLEKVEGVRYLDPDDGAYVHGEPRTRHATLEDFPSPLTTGELELVPREALDIIPIETNRGCPYSCTFCDWGAATMSRIRQFPLDRVRGELAWIAERGVTTWYIADANFGIVARDLDIAADLARFRADTGVPKIVVAFPAKNATERYLDIVDTIVGAGITLKAALALQTRDPATLKAVKRSNIKTDSYDQLAAESRRRGLPMLTELMIGLPGSTVESFKSDLQWGIERQVRAFLYPTIVLPNAPMNTTEQRQALAIRTVDGRLVSTSSFTEADRREMDRIADGYHCLEVFGTLRHVLRYLQWDQGHRAIDVVHQIISETDRHPERWPLLAFHLRHSGSFLIPPVGWDPLFVEAHRILVDHVGAPDDTGLRCALAVSRHLLASPARSFPETIDLEHDYVAYFASTQASLLETGEPGLPDGRLMTYGPGRLEVLADPLDVASLFGRWEEADPFQQAQDFEVRSALAVYYSSVGDLGRATALTGT